MADMLAIWNFLLTGANAVAGFCLNQKNGLTDEQIEQLRNVLTVNGRSYSSPIYKEGTTEVDMAASRRVEIKFRLKEDDMINKINEVLKRIIDFIYCMIEKKYLIK